MRRRRFLSTVGASAALLPVMGSLRGLARAAAGRPPKRLITFYVSSGCARSFFWPDQTGSNFELKTSLDPLAAYKSKMTILQGLSLGPGSDHRYGMDNCLTVGGKTSYENMIADALGVDVLNLGVAPLYSGDDMSVRAGMKLHGISDPQQARERGHAHREPRAVDVDGRPRRRRHPALQVARARPRPARARRAQGARHGPRLRERQDPVAHRGRAGAQDGAGARTRRPWRRTP